MTALGPQLVYVIGEPGSPLVKIGISGCPANRLRELQDGSERTLCPPQVNRAALVLLHQQPGGRRLELRLHRRFCARRVFGEWFDLGPLAVTLIRSACREPAETLAAQDDAAGWAPRRRRSPLIIDHKAAAARLADELGVTLRGHR